MKNQTSDFFAENATCEKTEDRKGLLSLQEKINQPLCLPAGIKPYYYDEKAGIVIYNSDCREILPELPKVDLVLTDPPYGEVNRIDSGLRKLNKGCADIVYGGELEAILSIQSSTFYVWCGTEQVSFLRSGFTSAGYTTRLCFWEKTNPSPMNGEHLWLSSLECCVFARKNGAVFNEFCKSPVWRGPTEREQVHPTEKPIWLFGKLVQVSSNENHTILDPFMGSGTTLVAAKQLGRRAIGIEIEEKYCAIAVKRLRQDVLDFA